MWIILRVKSFLLYANKNTVIVYAEMQVRTLAEVYSSVQFSQINFIIVFEGPGFQLDES